MFGGALNPKNVFIYDKIEYNKKGIRERIFSTNSKTSEEYKLI